MLASHRAIMVKSHVIVRLFIIEIYDVTHRTTSQLGVTKAYGFCANVCLVLHLLFIVSWSRLLSLVLYHRITGVGFLYMIPTFSISLVGYPRKINMFATIPALAFYS